MNQNMCPTLATSDAIAGIVFQNHQPSKLKEDEQQELEKACVDLLSKLEYTFATAKEMSEVDFIDESASIASDMLATLVQFSDQHLDGAAAEQVREEITVSKTMCGTFEEVLKTRSFGNAVMRTFWKADESDEIKTTREKLGKSLVRACAATLYHSIVLLGLDTTFGQELDSSAVVFVAELNETW